MFRLALPALLILGLGACQSTPIVPPQTGRAGVPARAEPTAWAEILPGQIAAARAAAARYRDARVAEAEGWAPFGGGTEEPLMGTHYYAPDGSGVPDYAAGDVIDPGRPNNLMYAEIGGERVLTGLAFVVRIGAQDAVPAGFAGPQDRWHVHDFLSAINAATEDRPLLRGLAARWLDDAYFREGDDRYRLAMIHVWTEHPNPDGVFADVDRTLPYRKLGLGEAYWDGASVEAARGLHLATEGGCQETVGAHLWIADASGAQERAVMTACRAAAEAVRSVLGAQAAVLNRTAADAWARFEAAKAAALSPEQRARIAAMTEHGGHGEHGEHDAHGAMDGHGGTEGDGHGADSGHDH